jgi:hypothetical protein
MSAILRYAAKFVEITRNLLQMQFKTNPPPIPISYADLTLSIFEKILSLDTERQRTRKRHESTLTNPQSKHTQY